MFAIFVLPPLYDLFCEALGIGGKTSGPYQAEVLTCLLYTSDAADE